MKIIDNLHAFMWQDMMANNCNSFLIQGSKNILIDPGHYQLFDHVQNQLSKLNLTTADIDVVILTHCHPDHMEAIKAFTGNSTRITIHQAEMDFISKMTPQYGDAFGISDFEPDFLLQEGDLNIGEFTFQVILTPGHSPGSVCLYWADQKVLFTGDVVFNQGVGRTDVPGGSGAQLKESINKISGLDVEYLLPGHMDIVSGCDAVERNFEHIKEFWFAYL
ncbi:MBL fold metallo-hydrolase [Thermodesulfobacteriota bacterium]